MMEEMVATRRVAAVMTMTSGVTTERGAEGVTTRMKARSDVATRSDDRSGRRPLLLVQLLVAVDEADVGVELRVDVEKMTACLKNGILLITNIDSESKSTSMTAQLASKYFYVASKTSPSITTGMKLTSLHI